MLETSDMPTFTTAKPYTKAYAVLFDQWCKDNNAHYYSRPADSFNIYEARLEAITAKASILLLDNLS